MDRDGLPVWVSSTEDHVFPAEGRLVVALEFDVDGVMQHEPEDVIEMVGKMVYNKFLESAISRRYDQA